MADPGTKADALRTDSDVPDEFRPATPGSDNKLLACMGQKVYFDFIQTFLYQNSFFYVEILFSENRA